MLRPILYLVAAATLLAVSTGALSRPDSEGSFATQPTSELLPEFSIVGYPGGPVPVGWQAASKPSKWAKRKNASGPIVGWDDQVPDGYEDFPSDPAGWADKPWGPGGSQVTVGKTSGGGQFPQTWIRKS